MTASSDDQVDGGTRNEIQSGLFIGPVTMARDVVQQLRDPAPARLRGCLRRRQGSSDALTHWRR
ncbi:hypothetical protein [Nonomuraea recticatena]|uniref:hypothetical protein n=1 Tax=Nonomuraea recticatena TaxID=46178 RepID=UPI00361B274B